VKSSVGHRLGRAVRLDLDKTVSEPLEADPPACAGAESGLLEVLHAVATDVRCSAILRS
jgi:hypothetical protein